MGVGIILCLVKWNNNNRAEVGFNTESFALSEFNSKWTLPIMVILVLVAQDHALQC